MAALAQPGSEGFPCSLHRALERIRPLHFPDKVRLILGRHSRPLWPGPPSLISSPATPAGGGNPFTLGQLPPPGSKGLSSGHWENPSHSPPTAEIHWHSHPQPVLPGSKGSGMGTSPRSLWHQSLPPPPAVRDPVLGTTSTAQQQGQTLPWPSGIPGKRVVPVLIPAWRHWLYWCSPNTWLLHRGFLLLSPKSACKPIFKTNPAIPYRRDPKSRAQCVLRVCHPQSSSRAAEGRGPGDVVTPWGLGGVTACM